MQDQLRIGLAGKSLACQQHLDLGTKVKTFAVAVIIERLDAEPIADEMQLTAAPIPDRKGEHTVEVLNAGQPMTLVLSEDHLGIGTGTKVAPARFKTRAQLCRDCRFLR